MESTSGGSLEAGAAGSNTARLNENQNMSWSTARRSTRKATRLENAKPWCSIKMRNSATEEGHHRKSKQIKTSASACPTSRDSSTPSSSDGCAKRRRSEQDVDGNITSVLSKRCKRMNTRGYLSLFKTKPSRCSTKGLVVKNAKQSSTPTKTKKMKESPFQKLQSLSNECHPDFDNDHLCAVKKLREFWHKSQGAALVDDKDIVMKTILFIMSLLPDVCQPFLVVTTAYLSLWEAEFKRFAPFINVVVYDGDKEACKLIQDLKFNTNGSSMMSHVFLAHPDALIEDIETVQCISWEAVIVECCQNSVLSFLKQLKQLPTDCRIVLLSSPPEDNLIEYRNLVAFLISEEEDNADHVDDNTLAIFKAKFTRQIAYERKTDSSFFLEYWVPTYLSKVQLQLYSSILVTNSSVLQSQVATDSIGVLGDIIQCLWKCCDHPCLVDEFAHNSLDNIDNETEPTDSRTRASGKLLLLEKMLREFRNKKSRVIVLFQSDGPGENKMGKILEEFVRHSFGSESYEYVQNRSAYSKKQAAMNMFNDRTKGRFVFLIENHACHSSICLSSIDAVIIYGSDWNPLNDLKALGKIQIESREEHVSIFRLYTPFTVEEKGLMLAKQGVIIDCEIQDIVPSLSHGLLSWGVSFLFSRLDELHQDNPSKSSERGKLWMDKVISEFLTVLSTHSNAATISKAYMSGEFYSRNITLVGETEGASSLDVDPPIFWLNLLDGKSPCRHLHESPQVKHKNLQNMEKLTNGPVEETNKGRRQHGTTGEIAGSSSKCSSDVSNYDVSPEITPSGADLQQLDGTRQKLGMGNLSTPKSLHVQLKCELSKLIKVLELPDNVRFLAEQLLEYLLKNHLLVREPWGILHAFNIALCWRAASLLKYKKLDHRDSLALAASSLNYEHNEELAGMFYKKLATLKEKVRNKPDKNSNKVENGMFSSEESSSTNLRNCHVFSKQAMNLHGNPTNSSPQEDSSGAEQIVSDGQGQIVSDGQVVSPPEAKRKCHFSSGEHPDMITKKRLDLFDKVFSVREKNILEKQQLELSDFQRYRENQVIKLKEVRSLVLAHIQRSGVDEGSRKDHLKLLVEWFSMLLHSFLKHMRLQLNKLEALQSETWFKDQLMKEKLKEEVVSGKLDQCLDLCTTLPDSNFMIEEFVHFKKILALGDQLSDNKLIMEITLVRNAVPSEAISTRPVGNEPAEALVSSGGASTSESGYLTENDINYSSVGIELQRVGSSIVPACHHNQLSSVSSQQSTDAPSGHQSVETESTGMLGTQMEQDLCPGMQPSTSLLDVPQQRPFTDDQSQAGCQLDESTDLSEEREPEYPTCATHNLAALSREVEIDNGQKSVPAQQSKSTHAQESLTAFEHPPEEAESAGIHGKLLPDDLHQSTSVQTQTADAKQAEMLEITEAQVQREIQPSTTTQDVPLERADLSGMLLMQSPTVLYGVEPSGNIHAEPSGTLDMAAAPNLMPEIQSSIHAEPSGTLDMAAAPNLMPEIQSSSSMQDELMGAERPGTSGTIAAQDLQPETQPSVSVQHIPPEGTHSDDMIQISSPGQQSTGLESQQNMAAPWHPAEHEEPDGILDSQQIVVADAFQPSTLMLNQTAEAERTGSLDAVATQDLHAELLPLTTAHDAPCEETDLSGMPVPQGTNSQKNLEVSLDTHAEREPANVLATLVAHDMQSGMQPSSSVQDQSVEAEGAGQLDTIAAEDLQPGTEPSTEIHHITPERTHPDERIQMSRQPNETPSQMSLQPNEAPISQLLTQIFSMGPSAFNNLMRYSEPLINELEKLKYCNTELAKRHKEKKLLLQAEYNKEMEKLNRKYESLNHKEDSAYHQLASQLDGIYYKVSMHQLVAENFHEKLTKSYASQERSASPTNGQVPQPSQQAPTRTSGTQTTASLVASSSVTQPSSSHSTGPLRSEAIQLQPILPENLYRATSSPLGPIPLQNGSYWAAGAQSRGPSPYLQHLRMPLPYATFHRDHQQLPAVGPGCSLLRHPAPGILTNPLACLPVTSISSSSVRQTMASASNSEPALPAPSPVSSSLAESMGNFGPISSTNPVVMAAQQVSNQNLDASAGIWQAGTCIAGVANPVFESTLETLPFQQRRHPIMAGSILPSSIVSSSAQPSASNFHPALATSSANPFIMAGQQGPSPNMVFHNNSVPLNAASGIWHTGTHTVISSQPVPKFALMNACPAGRTSEPTSAGSQRGGSVDVVCLSDDE